MTETASLRRNELLEEIFSGTTSFEEKALNLYEYQHRYNAFYARFCDVLLKGKKVKRHTDIPFLPIRFFKDKKILTGEIETSDFFESSGTTSENKSRHYINDMQVYEQSFSNQFHAVYGDTTQYCIAGLLPSYLEQGNSSLVYMVKKLIEKSRNERSGFYLYDHKGLHELIQQNEKEEKQTILFGVTYALIDFANAYPSALKNTIVIETGGMKGRKKELTRAEVHSLLKDKLGLASIHSEYGMTELFSQCYAVREGIFQPSLTMQISLRQEDDPLTVFNHTDIKSAGVHYKLSQQVDSEDTIHGSAQVVSDDTNNGTASVGVPTDRNQEPQFGMHPSSASGLINVTDLANIDSCAFIATDDAGKLYADGSFEVTGRYDNTDARGCSLMAV